MATPPEINVARQFTANAPRLLEKSQAFRSLPSATQQALLRDLKKINQTLRSGNATSAALDPYSFSLDTPDDFSRHRRFPGQSDDSNTDSSDGSAQRAATPAKASAPDAQASPALAGPKSAATQTLASRVGALSDEVNFPAFVAALVHGTFDAIVDATIRQMEAFADLVSAVAKDVDQFTSQNVSLNQARDWLVQHYPKELALVLPTGTDEGEPSLHVRSHGGQDEEPPSPDWL